MSLEQDVLDNNIKETEAIKDYAYPLNFEFKITSLANDFNVKDANGNSLAYVRQKMFKLKKQFLFFQMKPKQNYFIK